MKNTKKRFIPLLFMILAACQTVDTSKSTPQPKSPGEIPTFTADMTKKEGYFTFYYHEKKGKLFLEVDRLDQEFLYVNSLAAGLGSNDIGLDRGQIGNQRVVKFEKHGNKLLLIQPNYGYRAISTNTDEVKSVAEAFASSVIGGFEIKSRTKTAYLIDITDFLLRDSHHVQERLKMSNQGTYALDKSRSAIYMGGTFNFPLNTEFESLLTFSGKPGPTAGWVRSVTPSPDAITLRTHHSFIQLPDSEYTPRAFDPRGGFYAISYQDYATPIEEPLVKRFIVRHRLRKKDPSAAVSEAVEPIVYYVDRGAPEPIRSALIEGASWWNQAFEAAGYKDAFQVKIMPKDAHPLDIRYNVIQWVHRSTRGWSYGGGVIDPRTGEMMKGHVSLGSLRVRQDFLIATGLLQPYEEGKETPPEMTQMALARLRQLSAHEVGHTLGLAHNFAASVNDRASVMDYPHPYVQMDEQGAIDLSEAYDDKIGAWDKVSVAYGYSDFPEGEGKEKAILDEAFASGLAYITDQDARPQGGAHPMAHLWDNGTDPATELNRMMKIRRKILDDFSEKAIREGMPMSSMEEVLVPMYLFHRYQVDAASKVVGGLHYTYALRRDDQPVTRMLTSEQQMSALDALLATLSVEQLKLPGELLAAIPPRAYGYPRTRETFQSKAGPAFDYLAAVETAANVPLRFLFDPDRANRLVMFRSLEEDQPGFDQVLDKITSVVWRSPGSDQKDRTLERIVEMRMLNHLMGLAVNLRAYDEVKAKAMAGLKDIKSYAMGRTKNSGKEDQVYYQYVVETIDRFLDEPGEFKAPEMIKAPDGSPIGSCDHSFVE